jgi:hypothetical protein
VVRSAQRRHERKLEQLATRSHSVGTRCGCGVVEGVTANGLLFEALDREMRVWRDLRIGGAADKDRIRQRGIVHGLALGIASIQARSVDPKPRARQIEQESLDRIRGR